jgi:hypothetical protein
MLEEDAGQLGLGVFERKITMAGGVGLTSGDFATYRCCLQDIVDFQEFFQITRYLRNT